MYITNGLPCYMHNNEQSVSKYSSLVFNVNVVSDRTTYSQAELQKLFRRPL